jgi:hypothetical protein
MSYKYRSDRPKHAVLKKYRRDVFLLALVFLLTIGSLSFFIYYVSKQNNLYQPQTDVISKSFNPLKTFETPYFSFEADKSWDFVKKESTDNTFVYRSSKKNIVMRDMMVYVNVLPRNLLLTHVLPVEEAGNRFNPGDISEHCRDYLKDRIQPGNNNPIEAVVGSVRIRCQIDGTSYTAGTGKKNGSYIASLVGGNGQSNGYYLLYHDLEFTPRPSIFTNIVHSFRAK